MELLEQAPSKMRNKKKENTINKTKFYAFGKVWVQTNSKNYDK